MIYAERSKMKVLQLSDAFTVSKAVFGTSNISEKLQAGIDDESF
ncbi:MAG: hypothetical protein ACLFU9_00080 [Candidatus Bathyarchaeia archaeon]